MRTINFGSIGKFIIEKELIDGEYLALFTGRLLTDLNQLYICNCCYRDETGLKYLLAKTKPSSIIKLLCDELDIRSAFVEFPGGITITHDHSEKAPIVVFNDSNDWDFENSTCLPDKDAFMDVEDGEFDEEIEFYKIFVPYEN